MKRVYFVILLLPVILVTNQAQACTYTLTPYYYFYQLQSTNNPNRFLLTLKTDEKTYLPLLLDIENETLTDIQSSDQSIKVPLPSTQAQLLFTNVSYLANQSYLRISRENGSILYNNSVSSSIIPPRQNWFFYSETLDIAYFIWRSALIWGSNQANVTTITLENGTTTNQSLRWSTITDQIVEVYDEEQLIYVTAQCCLCVSGYYYRYSLTEGLEYLTTLDNWERSIIDTRVQRLVIMNSMDNQVEIIDYNSSQPIKREILNWSRSNLSSRFKPTQNLITSTFIVPVSMIMALAIIYRRRKVRR